MRKAASPWVMCAAIRTGQKQIAGAERIADCQGERDFPDAPVDLAVFDKKWAPGCGHEVAGILQFDLFLRAGIKRAQDCDLRHQRLALDRSLEWQGNERREILPKIAVPSQHRIEMAALFQPGIGLARRGGFDQSRRIDLFAKGFHGRAAIRLGEGVDTAEDTIHAGLGVSAELGFRDLDRIHGAPVHAGEVLVVHHDQMIEQCLAPLDQVADDEGVALRLGKPPKVAGILAATELAEFADDLGIDLAEIDAVGEQIVHEAQAHDIAPDGGGCGVLGIVLEAEQTGARISFRDLDQQNDGVPQALRQLAGNRVEQAGRRTKNLRDDNPLDRAGRRQHDLPISQAIVDPGQQLGRVAALEGALAQPIAEVGLGFLIEGLEPEVAADAQRLLPFGLPTTR
jgi:hypothetical protein